VKFAWKRVKNQALLFAAGQTCKRAQIRVVAQN
jgi:hypothetical protein